MIFALIGNQNSGKTTLFNQLTGTNQHVGNFPGVTVSQKVGKIKNTENEVVDLPGIYSLRAFTSEELVTRDFLIKNKPDGIINIVDATNLERNLYLSLQLIEMHIPMCIALNMMDEVRGNNGSIDVSFLSELLGVPIVPISASKKEGIEELLSVAINTAKNKKYPEKIDFCKQGAVHRCIHSVSHLIEDHAEKLGLAPRFVATKLVEGDSEITTALELNKNELDMLEHNITEMESEMALDRNAILADMRYSFIEEVCLETVVKCKESKERKRSQKIDKILTNKYLAIPTFLLIMLGIFWLTFDILGQFLSDLLSLGIDKLSSLTDKGLTGLKVNPVVISLVTNGIFAGVGSVLSFLPIVIVLFLCLSFLEDSGYMARIAFVMDKPLRKIGLSGKSFVPMLIGFGCSVPAVMATRTLASKRDKTMTLMLVPFMSCPAKIPIYSVFIACFFAKYKALLMMGIYLSGIALAVIVSVILSKTAFKGNSAPFIMELPNYRFPSPKSVGLLLWEKAKDFFVRAFTVIFVATLIIWFLQTFDLRFNVAEKSGKSSMLEMLGKLISPIFAPLGFGKWQASTSLISGFVAKEAVVSTMSVLLNTTESGLSASLTGLFTPTQAFSFLLFVLLYTPCFATISVIKMELNSKLKAFGVCLFQCAVAWLISFIFYQVASLIGGRGINLADIIVISIVIALTIVAIIFTIKNKKKKKCCGDCSLCTGCEEKKEK